MQTRRDFLQKMTGSVIALSLLPQIVEACSAPLRPHDGPMLRVAIMGLGSYGTRVAEAMQTCTKAKLVGVISGTPAKIKAWQAKYAIPEKNCYNYENFDRIKDTPDIDAVYVITPNALHHDQVIRVAKAGKQVISEKPMAVNAKEGQEMVDACKQAGVKLLVGYRMHFEPHTLGGYPSAEGRIIWKSALLSGAFGVYHRRPHAVAFEQDLIGRRLDDGHRHLFRERLTVYDRRRSDLGDGAGNQDRSRKIQSRCR